MLRAWGEMLTIRKDSEQLTGYSVSLRVLATLGRRNPKWKLQILRYGVVYGTWMMQVLHTKKKKKGPKANVW